MLPTAKKQSLIGFLLIASGGCGLPDGPGPITSVTIVPEALEVELGDTVQLEVAVHGIYGIALPSVHPLWTSSDTNVVSVSATGRARAKKPGIAVVSALADGMQDSAVITVKPLTFTDIGAGWHHTCALTTTGRIYCWGTNALGQIGNGSRVRRSFLLPTRVSGNSAFGSLSVGHYHNCAITDTGRTACWGENYQGQVGHEPRFNQQPSPVGVMSPIQFTSLYAARWHSCAMDAEGRAYCWGANFHGQLGVPWIWVTTNPVQVQGGLQFTKLSTLGDHVCGLASGGSAYCWGSNTRGSVGDGSDSIYIHLPTQVVGDLRFREISAGMAYTCGVTLTGDGWCWGLNGVGQLGDGTPILERRTPVKVVGGLTFESIRAGVGVMTCGLTIDKRVYCWGRSRGNGLGDGVSEDSAVPIPIAGNLRFSTLTVGDKHACGIATSGIAYCWGSTWSQAVGNGNEDYGGVPTPVFGQQ